MITIGNISPARAASWADLADELNRWGEEGRAATLWLRDDDAAAPSRRLDDLLAIAGDIPVALAVVPAEAETGLAKRLDKSPSVAVLQHGWRHTNHAAGGKKSEFPVTRPRHLLAADLAAGRARLAALFGARALAVMAPPWNRFEDALLPLLAAAGIGAISRFKPRRKAWPAPGVFEADVHVDLVAWREDRGFIGEAAALDGIIGHLQRRRAGAADAEEPTGILTHHLVQDAATGAFLAQLLSRTRDHAAASWLAAGEVFAAGLGTSSRAGAA